MRQPKSGVKWSLSIKLFAMVVAILAMVVGFLTISSSFLLKRDKIAYVYDAQATACALAGREFSAYAQASLDLVRHSLLLVDPFKIAPQDNAAAAILNPTGADGASATAGTALAAASEAQRQIQSLLDNQSVSLSRWPWASTGPRPASSCR